MNIKDEIPQGKKGQFVALDIEMFNQELKRLHRPHGDFACISIALEGDPDVYQIYDTKQLKKLFSSLSPCIWVLHNATYDLRQLRRWAEIKPRFIWDVMLVEQSMTGGLFLEYNLQALVRRRLGRHMEKGERKSFIDAQEMTPDMKKYAAIDALYTLELALTQRDIFETDPSFRIYKEIDQNMIFPVLDMPGVPVDVEAWKKVVEGFASKARDLEAELGVNVMAPAQVKLMAKKHGINLQSTGADVLAEFADNPFIAGVLETRMYRKAVSTYGEKWLTNVEADGKVYPNFNISRAETGRMSSNNPNIQQIPQRKLPVYRTLFVPSKGGIMTVQDVSQQEPSILAFMTKDPELVSAIKNKEDLHLKVAQAIFNDPKMKKEDSRRAVGKMINLGTSYGLSAYGLSAKINVPLEEAEKFLQAYFRRFSGVHSWITQQRAFAYRNGFVSTPYGRKIHVNLYSMQWENNSINAPIQGGAADFTKMWIHNYWRNCMSAGIPYALCAPVHDELVMDVQRAVFKENLKASNDAFQETAEKIYPGIPMRVDTEQGKSWACKSISTEFVDMEEGEDE